MKIGYLLLVVFPHLFCTIITISVTNYNERKRKNEMYDLLIGLNVFIIVGYLVYRLYQSKKVIKTRKEKTHEI